jgi:uncharacterized membrane protein YkvA (DUF1232 family)
VSDEAPRGFKAARDKAEKLARDSAQLAALLDKARAKARSHGARLDQVLGDFQDLLRLVRAYASGHYRRVPWTSLVTALAAVIYFVNPFDVIPDFLAGVGFLDDATVIAFCLGSLRKDLGAFLDWEKADGQAEAAAD